MSWENSFKNRTIRWSDEINDLAEKLAAERGLTPICIQEGGAAACFVKNDILIWTHFSHNQCDCLIFQKLKGKPQFSDAEKSALIELNGNSWEENPYSAFDDSNFEDWIKYRDQSASIIAYADGQILAMEDGKHRIWFISEDFAQAENAKFKAAADAEAEQKAASAENRLSGF